MIRRSIHRVLSDPWGYRLFCLALYVPMMMAITWFAGHAFDLFGDAGGFIALGVMFAATCVYGYRVSRRDGFSNSEIWADVRRSMLSLLHIPVFSATLLLIASIFLFQPLYKLNPELGDKIIWPVVFFSLFCVIVLTIRRNRSRRRLSIGR